MATGPDPLSEGWVVEPLEEGVALEDASHEQRGLGAHAEDDLVGLMLAAPRLPSPAHLLNPRRDAPGRVTAFRLAFVGADNYLRAWWPSRGRRAHGSWFLWVWGWLASEGKEDTMKKALAAMVVAVLLAISASSALAGGGGWAVRVKGGGRALVTWGTWSGTSTVHVDLPWRHSVRVSGFAVVTIAGQRESGGPGKIVCTVLHGGVVVARTVGSGPYATCQTSAGTS